MSEPQANADAPATFTAGLLAQFAGPQELLSAAAKVRDHGVRRWDAHSPFPVHGMERAMGMPMSKLPWIVLAGGVFGVAAALLLQWWTSAVDYKIVVSGKPLFSLPANIPVTFELLVLFAALLAFVGTLVFNLLPQYWHPVFGSERFRRATNDGFFISIDARDPKFDEAALTVLLESAGATAVEVLHDSDEGRKIPSFVYWTLGSLALVAVVPPLLIAQYRAVPKTQPRIHPILDMDIQPRYKPQGESRFFADARAMRLPVPGTVAEEGLELDTHFYQGMVDGQPAKDFPMPVTLEMAERGQRRFNIYCAACHGLAGEGGISGIVSLRASQRTDSRSNWVLPTSMQSEAIIEQPVGQLFQTITNGVRTMPAYGPQIPPADRWAIVLYIRALQRSQHATVDDVPVERRNLLH